jgi:hypothetical protein
MTRIALLIAVLLVVPTPASAGEVSVADLLADGAALEGEIITVEGELIGDFQRRNEWVWVQLNDDSYVESPILDGGRLTGANLGIALRFSRALFDAAGFDEPGRYGVRGPVARVTGVWRYHDEDRGGESYLDAVSFEVVERERRFDEELPLGVLLLGLALLVAGGGIALISRSGANHRLRRAASGKATSGKRRDSAGP